MLKYSTKQYLCGVMYVLKVDLFAGKISILVLRSSDLKKIRECIAF